MITETLEYLGIALVSSVLLIIMSKIILQALIRRPADYYDAEELRQEELMLNEGGISIANEHETNPEGETIEESHLEPQLGDSEPAEPEEIITDIPESVHESIEVEPHEETEVILEPDDVSELENSDGIDDERTEDIDNERIEEIDNERNEGIDNERTWDASSPASADAEETISDQEDDIESAAEDAEPETVTEPEPEPESAPIGFRIKAKTSREPQPKKKEDEEEPRPVAGINAEGEKVSGWTESYADIRQSLEKAFDENQKPSMRLRKQVLIDIAVARGIEIPEKATKRDILDLINSLDE